ncbi:hypothetical protein V6N13_111548 [Hibiscus sabdariffa]
MNFPLCIESEGLIFEGKLFFGIGSLCWALLTAAVYEVNGFGLALESFIADSYLDGVRGAESGLLSLVETLCNILGGVVGTPG